MKTKTDRNVKAAQKVEPECWWHLQLDTPVGRVELNFSAQPGFFRGKHAVRVRRADWLRLKSGRRLAEHHDSIDLERDSETGPWRPEADAYRNARDLKTAEAIGEAVTAWAEKAENKDLMRRALAFHECCSPMSRGPILALQERTDRLSRETESDLFDFDDGSHARAISEKAAHRLWRWRMRSGMPSRPPTTGSSLPNRSGSSPAGRGQKAGRDSIPRGGP